MEQQKQNNLALATKQNSEFWENLSKKVNVEVYGIKANPTALQIILSGQGRKAIDHHPEVIAMFLDVAQMFFGAKIENLNENLWINTYNRLITVYPEITLEEIEESYKSQDIIKPFGSLTVFELIQPILDYQKLKNSAFKQLKKANEEQEEQERFKKEEEKHRQESIKVYKESLEKGEWLGTPMHAHTLVMAKMLDYSFILQDEALQNELKDKAQVMFNKHRLEMREKGLVPIKQGQFLSEQTLLECLKRKKLVIVND